MSPTAPARPELFGRVDAATVGQVIERATSPGFETWWSRVASSGFCAAPVHLAGHDRDGRRVSVLGRCKNRRAAVCPSCSDLYAGDTWQLVHTGITPHCTGAAPGPNELDSLHGTDELAGHPMVFATLTAPSFGAVHTTHRGAAGRCHPTQPYRRCPHDRPAWCTTVHALDDRRLGEPLCPDCYDYPAHMLFSWHAPALWHRFTITLRRLVRRRLREQGEDAGGVRVAYVKVVELQRRGVPHFHTVVRLDAAATPPDRPPRRPDTAITATDLAVLVRRAVAAVHLDVPGVGGEVVGLRFGEQIDVQPVHPDNRIAEPTKDDAPPTRTARRVAAYLAKYVTKSVAEFGLSTRRLSVQAIDRLEVREHVRAILHTIAALAEHAGCAAMIRWLHTLGYRGHITTKTRCYSTTMGALRARREAWRQAMHDNRAAEAGHDTSRTPTPVRDRSGWVFTGSGHTNDGERLLAISAAARARENRDTARTAWAEKDNDECGDWAGAA